MSDFVFENDRESTIEDEVIAWAENNGWIARFMTYRGRRGCRDVDFYGYGEIVPMEFKKETGGVLSGNQANERRRLAAVGITIHVIDNVEKGIEVLKGKMP